MSEDLEGIDSDDDWQPKPEFFLASLGSNHDGTEVANMDGKMATAIVKSLQKLFQVAVIADMNGSDSKED